MDWLKELFNSISKVETSFAQTFPKDVFREPKVPEFRILCFDSGFYISIPLTDLEEHIDIDELKACLAKDAGWSLELCAMSDEIRMIINYMEALGCEGDDPPTTPCDTLFDILTNLYETLAGIINEKLEECKREQIEPMGPKLPPGYVEIGT